MLYHFTLTIPANTTRLEPFTKTVKGLAGELLSGEIFFPAGSRGLAGIRIFKEESQLYPSNAEEWFVGQKSDVEWKERELVIKSEDVIKLVGYNEDTTWSHSIYVYLNIVPEVREMVFPELRLIPGFAR